MTGARTYLAGLDSRLSRSAWTLELGFLVNAFGTGVSFPFLVVYLHNVRDFALGTAGLVVATIGGAGLVVGRLWTESGHGEGSGSRWALSSGSWELGYVIGPAIGGFVLAAAPFALWPLAAAVCVLAAAAAVGFERAIPRALRLTPA